MDRLSSMQVFRLVVELQGFAAAARRLDLSAAMVSKHVMALEQHLGTRLLHRTSRRLSLTDDGAAYLEQLRPLLDGLEDLETSLSQSARAPRGLLRISAPVWFANPAFVRLIAEYRTLNPAVQLDLDLSGRHLNLVEEGIDLALRVTTEPPDALIGRHIADIGFVPVVAPSVLAKEARPARAAELAGLPWLAYSLVAPPRTLDGPTAQESIRLPPPVLLSNNESILHVAAVQGLGWAFLPDWLVAHDLVTGRLERLLPHYPPQTLPLFGLYASRRHLSAKVRSFLDFLVVHGHFAATTQK